MECLWMLLCARYWWNSCTCRLLMRGRCARAWNFGPVTSDLGSMTLILVLLWVHLCPWCWCHSGQSVLGNYSWRVDVHVYAIVVLWLWRMTGPAWKCGCPIARLFAHKFVLDAAVARVSRVPYPNWVCGLPMRGSLDVHVHGNLVLWLLTLVLWPWPWNSCGRCCVIDANIANLCMWTFHEG